MKKEVFQEISNLKHSVDKLAGDISKERQRHDFKVTKNLKVLSKMIQKIFDIANLIFKEENKEAKDV